MSVAKRLNAAGVPSPWASKGEGVSGWNPACIRGILRNPNYEGETVQWRYKKIKRRAALREESECVRPPEGVTPAIVTPDLWERAQQRLSTNRGESRRNESRPYLLRGHILCGNCGEHMYPMPNGSRESRRRNYRCATNSRGLGCGARAVPADPCEAWVWGK